MTLEVIDCLADDAPARFSESLREIGFAVLANHSVPKATIHQAYAQWRDFFHSEEKHDFAFDAETHDGFIGVDLSETAKGSEVKDLKEFFHYYTWGRVPTHLEPITTTLFTSLITFAKQLLNWAQAGLPAEASNALSMPLQEMIQDAPLSLLRIIHYPPLTGNEPVGAMRAAAHEDINLLTLLPAATAKGLQVKNKAGDWLDVPCDEDWIIVNSGDMLQECTDRYYPATTHRVVNPEGDDARKERLSMPLFLHPRAEVRLSDRHTADSYRTERFKELGLL